MGKRLNLCKKYIYIIRKAYMQDLNGTWKSMFLISVPSGSAGKHEQHSLTSSSIPGL